MKNIWKKGGGGEISINETRLQSNYKFNVKITVLKKNDLIFQQETTNVSQILNLYLIEKEQMDV